MEQNIDIFISYKRGEGSNSFVAGLYGKLEKIGFKVFWDKKDMGSGDFPEYLYHAVMSCNDFILVLTDSCLEQLKRYEKIDWVREELLIAKNNNKNIIPLLMPNVTMPKDKDEMPEDLAFLLDKNAINIWDEAIYDNSPFDCLMKMVESEPSTGDEYKALRQSNPLYDVDEDLRGIIDRANNGDYSAMYEAATFHLYLTGENNAGEASKWYKKILDSDDEELRAHACDRLGGLYFSGSVPGEYQSFDKAFALRKIASKYNKNAAMINAAMMKIGSGCEFNYENVVSAFNELDQTDSPCISEQAEFFLTYGKFDKAIELFKKIQYELPSASYQLGRLYKLGLHTDPPIPDCYRAESYFRRAAKKGHKLAAYELGMLFYNPPKVDNFGKDFEQAVEFFKIAADAGDAESQYKLSWMYRFGLGCDPDIGLGIKYAKMAAEQGHAAGCCQLAYLYQKEGFINYQKAYKYAKLAADSGYAHGAFMCGNFLFLGRGCNSNIDEALKYYKYAYDHGSYEARIMIDKINKIYSIEE